MSTEQEIEELKRRLDLLRDQAEDEVRRKLAEARREVADLEEQLSQVTGRPSASQIKAIGDGAGPRRRRASISDEELKDQILQVLTVAGGNGINAKQIAIAVNQAPARVRQFVAANPAVLKRVGSGPGTKFYLP